MGWLPCGICPSCSPKAAARFWGAGGLGLMLPEESYVPELQHEALKTWLGIFWWSQGRESEQSRCPCAGTKLVLSVSDAVLPVGFLPTSCAPNPV